MVFVGAERTIGKTPKLDVTIVLNDSLFATGCARLFQKLESV